MSLKDLALKEVSNLFTLPLELLFMRVVKMESPYHRAGFVILGVPPWRNLEANDCYTKRCYQVWRIA
jgi:hypothetical protein